MNQYLMKVSRITRQEVEVTILASDHASAQATVLNAIELDDGLFRTPRCQHTPGIPEIVEIREINGQTPSDGGAA